MKKTKDKTKVEKKLSNHNLFKQMTSDEKMWSGVLLMLLDSLNKRWDEMRELAANSPKSPEIGRYFDETIGKHLTDFTLVKNTKVYRARAIKSYNIEQTGIFKKNIEISLLSAVMQKSEIDSISAINISPVKLIQARQLCGMDITQEQKRKIKTVMLEYSKKDFYGFDKEGSGIPPLKYRQDGRLNDKKDEYLYLSLEQDTCLYEMRPSINQQYSVAEGVISKDLKLVNFRDYDKYNATVVYKVSETNTDEAESFYYITQELAHYIQSKGYDGILYRSALKNNGCNIVLFNPNNVSFTSSSVVNIKGIQVDYNQLLPIKKHNK